MTMDLVVSDRKLYHLCGVPTSPRWSYCIQKCLYRSFRPVLLHNDCPGGRGLQVGLELLLRGLQCQLHRQHCHHCQLWVSACFILKNVLLNLDPWVSMWLLIDIWILQIPIFSLITSLDETRVMIGVYTMIGLSFAPNAFEYYQVIPNVIMNS